MKHSLNKLFHRFSKEAAYDRRQARMNDFLGQAVNIQHLEMLEREWFRNPRNW